MPYGFDPNTRKSKKQQLTAQPELDPEPSKFLKRNEVWLAAIADSGLQFALAENRPGRGIVVAQRHRLVNGTLLRGWAARYLYKSEISRTLSEIGIKVSNSLLFELLRQYNPETSVVIVYIEESEDRPPLWQYTIHQPSICPSAAFQTKVENDQDLAQAELDPNNGYVPPLHDSWFMDNVSFENYIHQRTKEAKLSRITQINLGSSEDLPEMEAEREFLVITHGTQLALVAHQGFIEMGRGAVVWLRFINPDGDVSHRDRLLRYLSESDLEKLQKTHYYSSGLRKRLESYDPQSEYNLIFEYIPPSAEEALRQSFSWYPIQRYGNAAEWEAILNTERCKITECVGELAKSFEPVFDELLNRFKQESATDE